VQCILAFTYKEYGFPRYRFSFTIPLLPLILNLEQLESEYLCLNPSVT
jgi:hypothetical protein